MNLASSEHDEMHNSTTKSIHPERPSPSSPSSQDCPPEDSIQRIITDTLLASASSPSLSSSSSSSSRRFLPRVDGDDTNFSFSRMFAGYKTDAQQEQQHEKSVLTQSYQKYGGGSHEMRRVGPDSPIQDAAAEGSAADGAAADLTSSESNVHATPGESSQCVQLEQSSLSACWTSMANAARIEATLNRHNQHRPLAEAASLSAVDQPQRRPFDLPDAKSCVARRSSGNTVGTHAGQQQESDSPEGPFSSSSGSPTSHPCFVNASITMHEDYSLSPTLPTSESLHQKQQKLLPQPRSYMGSPTGKTLALLTGVGGSVGTTTATGARENIVDSLSSSSSSSGSGESGITAAGTGLFISNGPTTSMPYHCCWSSPKIVGPPPDYRAAHSADVIGGNRIFIFGGWNGKKAMNDTHVLETDKDVMVWHEARVRNPPPERNNHTTTVVGSRLYVHGGHDGTKWLDDFHVLDTEKLEWTEVVVSGKLPTARACHTLSRVNDKIYLFGGYDGQRCFNEIDIFDLDTLSWIQPKVSGTFPQARNAHSMTVVESKLFLFGGHSGNRHLTDLHIFNTTTLSWSQPDVSGIPPPGLRGHTATLIGSRVVLFGGYDGKGRSNNLFTLETGRLKWLHPQDPEGAPVGRQRHSSCLVGAKRLFIFGGFDGTKWLNDLRILDVGKLTEDELMDTSVRALIMNLKKLVGDPEFADVVLVVEGREIPAHRNILAAQCDYFRSMFSGPMREAKQERVVIPDWPSDPYMGMLEFIYTGRLSETRPMVLCDVLGLSDQYGLDYLKTLCENILEHSVDYENVCSVLRRADKYQASHLKNFCNSYIFKHADEVSRTKGFEELSNTPWLLMDITRLSLRGNSTRSNGSVYKDHNRDSPVVIRDWSQGESSGGF